MTFIPQQQDKACFVACSEDKVNSGICDCVNRMEITPLAPMTEPVRIFKCPCDGRKYRLAGEPNDNPNFDELKEYWQMILQGCTVATISIAQFRDEGWKYCGGACLTPSKTNNKTK
jgi:hypothetical protein